jgi:hypothetical protein
VSRYLRDNLAGALEVMLGRPEGLQKLDFSLEGFWRSFAVFALILPFALLALISQQRLAAASANAVPAASGSLMMEIGVLAIDWISFPILFAVMARPLGLASRYVPFIVTRNWASVVVGAMMAVVHALFLIGVLPVTMATLLLFAAIAVALRFSYVITRITLEAPLVVALPIVIFDFLLSLTIWSALRPAS